MRTGPLSISVNAGGLDEYTGGIMQPKVRKTPSWPRSWANFSLFFIAVFPLPYRNAWANLHLLGQPNTLLAGGVAPQHVPGLLLLALHEP